MGVLGSLSAQQYLRARGVDACARLFFFVQVSVRILFSMTAGCCLLALLFVPCSKHSSYFAPGVVRKRVMSLQKVAACRDAASGVANIHCAGYIHCDVTASNVMVGGVASLSDVKVGDFGLAQRYGGGVPFMVGGGAGAVFCTPPVRSVRL